MGGCNGNCGDKRDELELGRVDSRINLTALARHHQGAVLGPTLGGGFAGSFLGSGVGRVGGGLSEPMSHAESPDPLAPLYPQVRVDFHFDYTTPKRIFERDSFAPLERELGGLHP